MSQSKKKKAIASSTARAQAPASVGRGRGARQTKFIVIAAVLALILTIVGVGVYNSMAPFHRVIITVDDISIRMGYFIKRTQMAGSDPLYMLEQLTDEQVIKLGAPQYVGEIASDEVDTALRDIARGESETISESEFKEWYRQQLNESGLSNDAYREIIEIGLLTGRMRIYLAERVATVADQVHLQAIVVATYEDAEEVLARLEEGDDFGDLAQEFSIDTETKDEGGDIGWFPRGVLIADWVDDILFGLEIGEVSEPIIYEYAENEVVYYIFKVIDQAELKEISEEHLQVLQVAALDNWMVSERPLHEISYHGLHNGFDSETYAWINYQISKDS